MPAAAAEPLAAIDSALDDLLAVRHMALRPEAVLALGEACERLSARVAAVQSQTLSAINDRDDVLSQARPGQAAAVFGQHVAGQTPARARRAAHVASLLRAEVGDLPRIGAALRAGDITAAHVDVAVKAHRDLGATARDALIAHEDALAAAAASEEPEETRAGLVAAVTELLADPSGPSGRGQAFAAPVSIRQVLLVDALLAHYATRFTVPELEAVAHRIVESLNPKEPKGTHERRYLYLYPQPDGSWAGRFECAAAQGAFINAVLAAFDAPRPGRAVDADGVEHELPDDRVPGARRMDALFDLLTVALAKSGITLPTSTDTSTDTSTGEAGQDDGNNAPTDSDGDTSGGNSNSDRAGTDGDTDADTEGDGGPPEADDPPEPPEGEGEYQVIREPGVLAGPFPVVELIVPVGIEHLAAAFTAQFAAAPTDGLPLDVDPTRALHDWLRRRAQRQHLERDTAPLDDPPDDLPPRDDALVDHPADTDPPDTDPADTDPCDDEPPRPAGLPPSLAPLARALSPHAVPARVEHAGAVDAATVRFLADCAQIRVALISSEGAVLHLGRTRRLVTTAQKRALIVRDGGCVIPGCAVTADACQAHHVVAWADGGPTDLENLALVCSRHHIELTVGAGSGSGSGWEITMIDGVPWVRPPSWVRPSRPLLRNGVHHPETVPHAEPGHSDGPCS